MTPVTVDSYLEFVEKFGTPSKGLPGSDVWRGGDITSPTYGSYAAQSWLKNSTPLTFIRLLGIAHPDPLSTGFQQAGWGTTNLAAATALGTNGRCLWFVYYSICFCLRFKYNSVLLLPSGTYKIGGIRLTGSRDMDGVNSIGTAEGARYILKICWTSL